MGSLVDNLARKGLISPPPFMRNAVQFEVNTGSVAYGVSSDVSDMDIYGFCIPPKDIVFPHLRGEIDGFGRQKKRFEQFTQHHIQDLSANKVYDVTIFNIVKYFSLCMENNPNMIDSLFVPQRCILHSTPVANYLREHRKEFLHKGSWHKFKGYAFSQVSKMKNKALKQFADLCEALQIDTDEITLTTVAVELRRRGYCAIQVSADSVKGVPLDNCLSGLDTNRLASLYEIMHECVKDGGQIGKRLQTIKTYGYDVKFAYHVVRLLNEVEQILIEQDLDLERNREQLKSIRRGEWTIEQIDNYFQMKERELESVYIESKLPHSPNELRIKNILLDCLEMYYGSLNKAVVRPTEIRELLGDLQQLVEKYGGHAAES